MELNDIISRKVTDYYLEHQPSISQIRHTQTVAAYTRLIAVSEGLEGRELDLIETAAWLHDIGCPNAREKYGDSLPAHQQDEGQKLVYEWLNKSYFITNEEIQWLAEVVGSHHQFKDAIRLHFEPLFEADAIINMIEGNHKPEQAQHIYDSWFTTDYGKTLFHRLFL